LKFAGTVILPPLELLSVRLLPQQDAAPDVLIAQHPTVPQATSENVPVLGAPSPP